MQPDPLMRTLESETVEDFAGNIRELLALAVMAGDRATLATAHVQLDGEAGRGEMFRDLDDGAVRGQVKDAHAIGRQRGRSGCVDLKTATNRSACCSRPDVRTCEACKGSSRHRPCIGAGAEVCSHAASVTPSAEPSSSLRAWRAPRGGREQVGRQGEAGFARVGRVHRPCGRSAERLPSDPAPMAGRRAGRPAQRRHGGRDREAPRDQRGLTPHRLRWGDTGVTSHRKGGFRSRGVSLRVLAARVLGQGVTLASCRARLNPTESRGDTSGTAHAPWIGMARRSAAAGNPKVACCYLRCSTDKQDLSPEAQEHALRAYCAANGITIAATFLDFGVSGGNEIADRPGLIAALAALREHGAGLLLVKDRTRLARDVYVAASIEREVRARGARVSSTDGAGNGDSPTDRFAATIMDAASELHRAMIKANTKSALQAKKARGERVGTVPYGYAATEDGRLVEDAAEQGVLAVIRELHAAGMSSRRIAAELTARGILSRAGKPFLSASLCRLVGAGA